MNKWLHFILSVLLVTLTTSKTHAQSESETDFVKNTQQDIMLVGAAGGAGAILGLSTLSFYDTPSKHIRNVWTGAALGVIAGVIFVAYNSAQKGSEDLVSKNSTEEFSTGERSIWHSENSEFLTMQSVQFGTQIWEASF